MALVSVIVNTLNRAEMLNKVLESFKGLKYKDPFEVIVINGPSIDATEEILNQWTGKIRIGKCAEANLSISRNIGIKMAAGEFVVFIDDDAYPEPEWLDQMIAPFIDPEVAAVGGIVYDHTGYNYQYEYRTATRLLNCNWNAANNSEHLCFPLSFEFPYPPGGNAAYRRDVLIAIGGFDEEIEYYGDETDVAVRLVDAGYVIKNIVGGYIHHKSGPSHIRNNQKMINNWYPILKNKLYFALKNGRTHLSLNDIENDYHQFSNAWKENILNQITAGILTKIDLERFEEQNRKAWSVGISRAKSKQYKMLTFDTHIDQTFLRFSVSTKEDALVIVLISQQWQSGQESESQKIQLEYVEALVSQGFIIHVVTQSHDINRVDLENGVWIHRVLVKDCELSLEALKLKIPQRIWSWSYRAREEIVRISQHRKISMVEASIWDCQAAAFILDKQWPLITSIQSTLTYWLICNPAQRFDTKWREEYCLPMLDLEKKIMLASDGILFLNPSIRSEIEKTYNFIFEKNKLILNEPLALDKIIKFYNSTI